MLPRKAWYPRPDGCSQQPGVSPRPGATRSRAGTGLAGPENPRLPLESPTGTADVNPFGNFSDTSGFRSRTTKGSLGHSFEVRIITGDRNQGSFYPYVRHEISLLVELPFGHPCCLLTDVPPQPNSPPNDVFGLGAAGRGLPGLPRGIPSEACDAALARKEGHSPIPTPPNEKNNDGDGGISGSTGVSHLCYVRPCCFSTSD